MSRQQVMTKSWPPCPPLTFSGCCVPYWRACVPMCLLWAQAHGSQNSRNFNFLVKVKRGYEGHKYHARSPHLTQMKNSEAFSNFQKLSISLEFHTKYSLIVPQSSNHFLS